MKLKMILSEKKTAGEVFSIPSDAPLREAATMFCVNKAGSLLVTDPDDMPVHYIGIITEHDIVKKVSEEVTISDLTVADTMRKDLIIATTEDDVDYIMKVMTRHKIHHVPILEKSKIVGVISMGDIMRSKSEADAIQIHYLSEYTSGTYGNKEF